MATTGPALGAGFPRPWGQISPVFSNSYWGQPPKFPAFPFFFFLQNRSVLFRDFGGQKSLFRKNKEKKKEEKEKTKKKKKNNIKKRKRVHKFLPRVATPLNLPGVQARRRFFVLSDVPSLRKKSDFPLLAENTASVKITEDVPKTSRNRKFYT